MNRQTFSMRVIIPVAIILILVLALSGLQPIQAQSGPSYSVTVHGTGIATGAPDVAIVDLGVELFNTNPSAAFSNASSASGSVTEALLKLGVSAEDIRPATVVISPEDRVDPRTGPTGNFIYRVTSTLHVTLHDMTKVSQVLSAAVDAGANSIDNFTLAVFDITSLEQKARTLAVTNANERAKQLADALGATVGDAIIVSETVTDNASPAVAPTVSIRPAGGQSASTDVSPLSVTVEVEVTFNLRTQR